MLNYPPYWNAFNREAALSSEAISSGLESLRKADYASPGLYSFAFFGLANGLERLFKLVFTLDYAVRNGGVFPTDDVIRNSIGHDLKRLFDACSSMIDSSGNLYAREEKYISLKVEIVEFLTEFALYTRYYNLNLITRNKRALKDQDPLKRWFVDIGDKIRKRHYTQKMKDRDLKNAVMISKLAELTFPHIVMHTSEDGSPISDMFTGSFQTSQTKFMQKYGTFYCTKLCRYSYRVLYNANINAIKNDIMVPYMHEHFFPFENSDKYLLSRKTFTPRVRQGRG